MRTLLLIIIFAASASVQTTFASDLSQLTPADLTQQGIAAYNRGDYSTAIQFLTSRANLTPSDPNVLYYLGNSYLATKQTEKAARVYSACVRLAPQSQAGQYSLTALESLSALPKATPAEPVDSATEAEKVAAAKDALVTEKALDKSFNEAVLRIRNERHTLQQKIDRIWTDMQDDMRALSTSGGTNYAMQLEKMQREAENDVLQAQIKELRFENRLLAPEKIDVRFMPQMPEEKPDNTKTALGSLLEYFKPEKTFDPLAADITPEVTAKFLTIKDVFGELSTYPAPVRRLAKQAFVQLKKDIECRQDTINQDIYQLKTQLIAELIQTKSNYGTLSGISGVKAKVNPTTYITASKIPRSDQSNLSPMDTDLSQAAERAKKRIGDLEATYYRDVDGLIAGAKERVGGMVVQAGHMNKQLQHPSGNIQLVPLGTDMYTRNYVIFGDRPELMPSPLQPPAKATAKSQQSQKNGQTKNKSSGAAVPAKAK